MRPILNINFNWLVWKRWNLNLPLLIIWWTFLTFLFIPSHSALGLSLLWSVCCSCTPTCSSTKHVWSGGWRLLLQLVFRDYLCYGIGWRTWLLHMHQFFRILHTMFHHIWLNRSRSRYLTIYRYIITWLPIACTKMINHGWLAKICTLVG